MPRRLQLADEPRAANEQWWQDAYLVAARINQIAEHYLHDSPYPLDDAASLLAGSGSRAGRLAGRVAAATALAARRIAARSERFRARSNGSGR